MSATRGSGLTRKQRREQARTERKAAEVAKQARAAQRKRLTQLSGVIGVVVVIIAIIFVVAGEGSSKPPARKSRAANLDAVDVISLLRGIPESGNVLGSPNAPVTLEYFGDLECPYCKQFTLEALPSVIDRYVRTGKVMLEYRSIESATRDPEVFTDQQVAALAAGKQNKMWYYVELFYHEQGQENSGYVTESYLAGLAEQVPGLSLNDWSIARKNQALSNAFDEEVNSDKQVAIQNGWEGTPSFTIGKTGGVLRNLENASITDPSSFETAIEKMLKS